MGHGLLRRDLAWQDQGGQVWLSMVDPQALKQRYALGPDCDGAITTMGAAVRKFLEGATAP